MTNVGRIVAAEIAWPIEIVAGANNLVVDMTVSGVSTIYNVALTPGYYWSHKFKIGLPGCFATHIAARIQAVTGQVTQAQRGIQLMFGGSTVGPAWRFIHTNPAVTASSIQILDPSTTVPKDLLGWHVNDAVAGQWSEHITAGSFAVIDKAYNTAYKRARLPEWRSMLRADNVYSSDSPNAFRSTSDVRRVVNFEASGIAAPFINDALMTHTPTLNLVASADIAESRGSSLNNLWDVDTDDLRYYVQLDNASAKRHWWAPCRIDGDNIEDLSKWRSDETGYPGEHHRVRIPLRLTADMIEVI
jgi:hypothetical protein